MRAAVVDLSRETALDHRDEPRGAHVRGGADRARTTHEGEREQQRVLATEHGATRVRAAARPLPALAGILSFVAYALVLAALLRASAAAVASVRETSVLIAAFLAAPLAGERVGPGRLAEAALVVAGVALIAAG